MRRASRILALLVVLLLPRVASAQATLDAFANDFCGLDGSRDCGGGFTTLTIPLTVAANSNRSLAAVLFIGCAGSDTAPNISTVTWDTTQSLTQLEAAAPASSRRGQLWALPAGTQPNTGAHNLVVTLAAALNGCASNLSRLHGGVFSVYNVDQSTTFTDTNVNSGSGASATLTLTGSGANDLGFDGVCAGDGLTSTTETSKWSVTNTNTSCNSSGGATAAGSDTSFSWSIPSDSWIMVGGSFKAVGAGGGTPKGLLLLGCCEVEP